MVRWKGNGHKLAHEARNAFTGIHYENFRSSRSEDLEEIHQRIQQDSPQSYNCFNQYT